MGFKSIGLIGFGFLALSCDNKKEDVSCFSKAEKISAENKNETEPVLAAEEANNPAALVASSNQASGQKKDKCNQLMDESMAKEKICPIIGPGHNYWYSKKVGDESTRAKVNCD